MNYCSLEDAFQITSGGQAARKEERKKARKCRGPALTFLEATDPTMAAEIAASPDPDRQHLTPPPTVPAMNKNTGVKVHKPVSQAWNWWSTPERVLGQGEMEPFQDVDAGSGPGIEKEVADQRMAELLPRTDDDPEGDKQRATLPTPQMLASASSAQNPKTSSKKSYFGADPTDDNFADYKPGARNFLIEPDFTTQFAHANAGSGPISPQAASGQTFSPALPIPSVRDVWKPVSSGPVPNFDTSFYSSLPPAGGLYPAADKDQSYQSLSRKIDRIMDRLDGLNKSTGNSEQSQMEVLMFVSSGVFVLFLMDLLVKKGATMKFF